MPPHTSSARHRQTYTSGQYSCCRTKWRSPVLYQVPFKPGSSRTISISFVFIRGLLRPNISFQASGIRRRLNSTVSASSVAHTDKRGLVAPHVLGLAGYGDKASAHRVVFLQSSRGFQCIFQAVRMHMHSHFHAHGCLHSVFGFHSRALHGANNSFKGRPSSRRPFASALCCLKRNVVILEPARFDLCRRTFPARLA